jgi:hypothetical protein
MPNNYNCGETRSTKGNLDHLYEFSELASKKNLSPEVFAQEFKEASEKIIKRIMEDNLNEQQLKDLLEVVDALKRKVDSGLTK